MVEAVPDSSLTANWVDFDLVSFSQGKTLWDYQQRALRNALKALWRYYEDFVDYKPSEDVSVNYERKRKFWEWYKDNGLTENFSIDLSRLNYRISNILRDYYETNGDRIDYLHFINRMCFWMATGSGKTLVIVKLIYLLSRLIQRGEIPAFDTLFLTHRDDLLAQLRRHVEEFNRGQSDLRIVLRDLREFASAKREAPSLFKDSDVTVFCYRSDNLSDEQKEKLVDFRNYENNGRWYVLLDEAHKGDKEESKRQHLYSILCRNGFLFNFSATFTDARDIATTVFNFNLSEYIRAGYGKHIAILKQEMRAFQEKEDYTSEEKQKVVLKALMMLAYAHRALKVVHQLECDLYHRPLMLVLVNSVNTEDADLKLFFRELERIAREGVGEDLWEVAKRELEQELDGNTPFEFEDDKFRLIKEIWQSLTICDVFDSVFNATGNGEIEVLIRPSNRQEMAFKLKTADRPFALIKIGDISNWLKNNLTGYEIAERFEDESYFARLNEDDSDIKILMGSRTFYEGWDSNRPNVICYINIGVGEDARKFILQSVGRGARIEPLKNKRRRLIHLYNAGEVSKARFDQLKEHVQPLETLFIFGTNRHALKTVIEGLTKEREKTGEQELPLFKVNPQIREEQVTLLVPVYRRAENPLAEWNQVAKFGIYREEFDALKSLVEKTDDRVLLMLGGKGPVHLRFLRKSFKEPNDFYLFNERRYGNLLQLLQRVLDWWAIQPEEIDRMKELEDEIRHFRSITVTLEDITELRDKVVRVRDYKNPSSLQSRLITQLRQGEITEAEFKQAYDLTTKMVKEERFEHEGRRIAIKHIERHYYLPVILSEDERAEYIHHIIRTPSEVRFVNDLEQYLSQAGNKFREFDWWFFSKLDESLDEVYIPYYDPKSNRIARFKPDFIFWLKFGGDYFIIFVDPKGTEHIDWIRKVEGYRMVFREPHGSPKILNHDGSRVSVHLFLWTSNVAKIPDEYRDFWFDEIDDMLRRIMGG